MPKTRSWNDRRRWGQAAAAASSCGVMLSMAVVSSAATATRASKIPVSPMAVGTPPQRAVGYVAVRTPPSWGRWSPTTGVFAVKSSSTCAVTIRVGAGLTTATSPTRQLHLTINSRNGGNVVVGKTSSGHGVWGAQAYGPGVEFQLEGTSVVKLASRRMAQLTVQLTAGSACKAGDGTEDLYGPIEHMLRTARFHLRLKPDAG